MRQIVTHPENIPLFDDKKTRKGVGAALITHIANDILQQNGSIKKLSASVFAAAMGFYEKQGFEPQAKSVGYIHIFSKLHDLIEGVGKVALKF